MEGTGDGKPTTSREEKRRKLQEAMRRADEWAERRAAKRAAREAAAAPRGVEPSQSRNRLPLAARAQDEPSSPRDCGEEGGRKGRRERLEECVRHPDLWAEQRAAGRATASDDESSADSAVGEGEGRGGHLSPDRDRDEDAQRLPARGGGTPSPGCAPTTTTKKAGTKRRWLGTYALRVSVCVAVSALVCFTLPPGQQIADLTKSIPWVSSNDGAHIDVSAMEDAQNELNERDGEVGMLREAANEESGAQETVVNKHLAEETTTQGTGQRDGDSELHPDVATH